MEESQRPKSGDKIGKQNIVQLPNNYITWGLVPLEELFYHYDVPFKPVKRGKYPTVHEQKLGSQSHPKLVNLSSELTAKLVNLSSK